MTTLFGRRRRIAELASSNKNLQHFGERVAMNSPIQGTAADIIKIAMINVSKALRAENIDARLILQVHDELIVGIGLIGDEPFGFLVRGVVHSKEGEKRVLDIDFELLEFVDDVGTASVKDVLDGLVIGSGQEELSLSAFYRLDEILHSSLVFWADDH